MLFSVTYEIVTAQSAEHGDAAERGFEWQNANLRDAVKTVLGTRSSRCSQEVIEAFETGCGYAVRVINSPCYDTGEQESRTLHIPPLISRVSARRIAKICGAHFIYF